MNKPRILIVYDEPIGIRLLKVAPILISVAMFWMLCCSGCAFVKPRPATDPVYIAAYQKERQFWEKRASKVYPGMTRKEVLQILPRDESLSGITDIGSFVSAGKTRAQAHIAEWYYVSPHYICSIEYDFTGLNYEPQAFLLMEGDDPYPEFPDYVGSGSDPMANIVLAWPTITLVEPSRVKKPRR
jgi:hypothetical protein